MQRVLSSDKVFWAWLLWALAAAAFHEPWRDEAQAWLVARSATGLVDLALRASGEATGPLYYLLLYPLAQAFPTAFPHAIWVVSFAGTLGVAILLTARTRGGLLATTTLALTLFGYLYGYEYAAVARLYGVGSFLLLLGICLEERGSRWGILLQGLTPFVQLNFAFALIAWRASQSQLRKLATRENLIAGIALFGALAHLQWGSEYRYFPRYGAENLNFASLGTTLSHVFLPSSAAIGFGGFAIAILGFWVLSPHHRIAFLLGVLPYSALFCLHYSGRANARHAGALFLVWLLLSEGSTGRRAQVRGGLLIAGILAMLGMAGAELWLPYSDGARAANAIAARRQEGQALRLYAADIRGGFVPAAYLGTELYQGTGKRYGFPNFTSANRRQLEDATDPTSCTDETIIWLGSGIESAPTFGLACEWQRIFEESPHTLMLNEAIAAYQLLPRPHPK